MLTPRGWWFLIIVMFVLTIGAFVVPNYTTLPAILAVTLLAWFVYEWVQFQFRSSAISRLHTKRWMLQNGRGTPMIWSGVPFEVTVAIGHDGLSSITYAVIEDRLPFGVEVLEGSSSRTAALEAGEQVHVRYLARSPAPGLLRFEGVQVRVADLHGFFYRRVFLRDPIEYLVLPPLIDDEGKQRADKRFNMLPPPGIHRLRRPGAGDELLDLRDYRPGDPPKMIAWKASARKDTLITKEYENEVPVRCVLFLDTSDGVRLGPPGNTLLTRMASVSAVVAQAAGANRDLVGLTTFDDKSAVAIRPARTKTHMINIMSRLAEVSSLAPTTKGVTIEALTARAYPLAHELYPEMMSSRNNTMPLGRLWYPLLDRWWGWIIFFIIVLPPLLAAWKVWNLMGGPPLPGPIQKVYQSWMATTFDFAARITPKMFWVSRLIVALFIWVCTLCFPTVLAALFWFFYGIRGWFGTRPRILRMRKQLAALFSIQDGTGADGIERYIYDDKAFGDRATEFLEQHRQRCPVPLYDENGCYRFRNPHKTDVLAYEMIRAVGRARDNELYVLLADLSELGDDLEPLIKACRVARARRHQVMVIVPWPADLPPPDDQESAPKPPTRKRSRRHPDDVDFELREQRIAMIVKENLARHYHASFRKMRRALTRVGVTVLRSNDGDPVRLVLDRLDRLRGMRTRR